MVLTAPGLPFSLCSTHSPGSNKVEDCWPHCQALAAAGLWAAGGAGAALWQCCTVLNGSSSSKCPTVLWVSCAGRQLW